METNIVYWGYIGIMEKNMETNIVYWGYIGIMQKKMEATIVYWGDIVLLRNYFKDGKSSKPGDMEETWRASVTSLRPAMSYHFRVTGLL